jgi:hypothetical protein
MSESNAISDMLLRWARALYQQADDSFVHNIATLASQGDAEILGFIANSGLLASPRAGAPAAGPDLELFFRAAAILNVRDDAHTQGVVDAWRSAQGLSLDDIQRALSHAKSAERAELLMRLGADPLKPVHHETDDDDDSVLSALGLALVLDQYWAVGGMLEGLAKQDRLPTLTINKSVLAGQPASEQENNLRAREVFSALLRCDDVYIYPAVVYFLRREIMPESWRQVIGQAMGDYLAENSLAGEGKSLHDVELGLLSLADLDTDSWRRVLQAEVIDDTAAVQVHKIPFAKYLVNPGMRPKRTEVLQLALDSGISPDEISCTLDDGSLCPLLQAAIESGVPRTVKMLLTLGADPRIKGQNGLDGFDVARQASENGHTAIQPLLDAWRARHAIGDVRNGMRCRVS